MSQTSIILSTDRLYLRHLTASDRQFIGELLSNDDVMRYYPQSIIDQGPDAWIDRHLARYKADGIGAWLAIRKVDQQPIGQIGLSLQDVNGVREPEVGYLLHRSYWGVGYATEAAAGCIDYGLNALTHDRIVALIRKGNHPSIAVAQRLHMIHDGVAQHGGMLHQVYATKPLVSSSN